MTRRPPMLRPLALGLLLLALAGCSGGESQSLSEAQLRLDRGEIELALAALRDLPGGKAEELRARGEAMRRHRGQLEREVEAIFAGALEHEPNWARVELKRLLVAQTDPVCVAQVEQALSDMATYLAERRASRPRALVVSKPGQASGADPTEDSAAENTAGSPAKIALAAARAAQRERQWSAALAELASAEADEALAPDARLARLAILSGARVDAESLLVAAKQQERAEGAPAAARRLRAEVARFPADEQFDGLRLELRLLESRAQGGEGGARAVAGVSAQAERTAADQLASAESADECSELARALEHAGDLIGARRAWLEAARRRDEFLWRQACDARARELDYRIAMRQELADFARLDPPTASALGERRAVGASADLAELGALDLFELLHLLDRASVSNKARLGWTIEAIARGTAPQRELALAQLGEALQRGDIDPVRASGLVARAKGELGDGGWAFQDGRWIAAALASTENATASASVRKAALARRVGQFVRSDLRERDRLFGEWLSEGDPELIANALQARAEETWRRIERSPVLRQLAGLAEDRRRLDAARDKALALIFDELRYFYPYTPPACPPDQAAKYPAVQREVDVLVGEVRKAWEGARRVKPGAALRELLDDLGWTIAKAAEWRIALPKLPAESKYVLALPAGEDVGLREFAWDAGERAALDLWDRIEARNERLWRELDGARPTPEVPDAGERDQVRITNAYRRLLGRGALAWNPKLQSAAQGHSDYMANSGNFGHAEEGDPARRTPMDRMLLVGYTVGVSENVSMGRGDPKSAHEGWCQSSGHHRNLLEKDHREMASAIAATYWTQNFGVDSSFLADL